MLHGPANATATMSNAIPKTNTQIRVLAFGFFPEFVSAATAISFVVESVLDESLLRESTGALLEDSDEEESGELFFLRLKLMLSKIVFYCSTNSNYKMRCNLFFCGDNQA